MREQCRFDGTDGFVPSTTSGASVCKLGAGGVLTDPNDDRRTWFWALPSSGVSGMQCFYNCKALVGGNGTAWSSSNTGYTYMRVDRAGQAGYLTAA